MRGFKYYLVLIVGCLSLLVPIICLGPRPVVAGGPIRSLKYQFRMTSPANSRRLSFEDEFIKASFDLDRKKISLSLLNHSGKPLKIDWDQASYIDPAGQSHKCLHAQSTTFVPPGVKIKDLIIPADYPYFQNTERSGPQQRQMEFLPEAGKKQAAAYKGKFLSVLLPVEENGVVKKYLFTFKIDIGWQ